MKQGLVRLLYNFGKRFMGWTLHMIMCVLLCYPVCHSYVAATINRTSYFYFHLKMLSHQTNKDKPRSNKCRHFCFPFDTHNYCHIFENPCQICGSFTEEQMLKISQRKCYIKKQKCHTASSKDDELDLLGDDVDSFACSNTDLESAADNTSQNCPTHPRYCLTAEN